MSKCPKCNASLSDEAKFCGVCGYEVESNREDQAFNDATVSTEQMGTTPGDTGYAPGVSDHGQKNISNEDIVFASIKDGWRIVKGHFFMILFMMLFVAFINIIPNMMLGETLTGMLLSSFIGAFLGVLNVGLDWSILKYIRNEEVEFETLFSGFKKAGPLITAGLVMAVIFSICFTPGALQEEENMNYFWFLLYIPGVVIAIGLSFTNLLIMDKDLDGITALKTSWQMMSGYKFKMFLMAIVLVFLNVLGVLALIIGVFVTLAIAVASVPAFYNRMLQLNPPEIK